MTEPNIISKQRALAWLDDLIAACVKEIDEADTKNNYLEVQGSESDDEKEAARSAGSDALDTDALLAWLDEQIAECQAMIDRHSYFGYQSHYSGEEIEAENSPHKLRRDVFQEVKSYLEAQERESDDE